MDLPGVGRLIGLDFGTRRFGVAVSNYDQTIASPVANWERKDLAQDARFLTKQVAEFRAVGLVVGLPVHMSGDEGEKAQEARAFGTWASTACGLPVAYHDERFSTLFADEELRAAGLSHKQRQARRDMLAAQFFLQSFLDARRGT